MASKPLYVPTLKARRCDLDAFTRLGESTKSAVKPLLEIPLRPSDCGLLEHIEKSIKAIGRWGACSFFFDPYGLLPGERLPDGSLAEIYTLQHVAKFLHHQITPLYGLDRAPQTWTALRPLVSQLATGFGFRITLKDVENAFGDTWEQIVLKAAALNLSATDIDLVLDLRDIAGRDVDELLDIVVDFIAEAPDSYRSMVLLGSSTKKTVADVPRDGRDAIARTELQVWARLHYELAQTVTLHFGDYVTTHPDFIIAGKNKNANAKIRYTAGYKTHYFRGHGLYKPKSDFAQYHDLAKAVVNSGLFYGHHYSWGDSEIARKTESRAEPGNLSTWIKIASNHHMAVATEQLVPLSQRLSKSTSTREVDALLNAL